MVDEARADRGTLPLSNWKAVHDELKNCFEGYAPRESAVELGRARVLSQIRN